MPEASGIVLAGGRSRRLGANKAFVQVGGVPLIERVLERLNQVSDDIIVVTDEVEACADLGVKVIRDVWPGKGTLGGIYSGLRAAHHDRALVTGCDMPFLDVRLLRFMILLSKDYDVVIPKLDGLLEPLHAVYSKASLGPIERLLQAGDLRIVHFLPEVRVRYVDRSEVAIFDPQLLSFFNVNTQEDLQRAQELASRQDPPA